MIDLVKPAKAPSGPTWVEAARVGDVVRCADQVWKITKVENIGRVIHWRGEDGRVARTECMPDHPSYPKDLTREQELAKHHARKAKKKAFFDTFGYWPSDAQV